HALHEILRVAREAHAKVAPLAGDDPQGLDDAAERHPVVRRAPLRHPVVPPRQPLRRRTHELDDARGRARVVALATISKTRLVRIDRHQREHAAARIVVVRHRTISSRSTSSTKSSSPSPVLGFRAEIVSRPSTTRIASGTITNSVPRLYTEIRLPFTIARSSASHWAFV